MATPSKDFQVSNDDLVLHILDASDDLSFLGQFVLEKFVLSRTIFIYWQPRHTRSSERCN